MGGAVGPLSLPRHVQDRSENGDCRRGERDGRGSLVMSELLIGTTSALRANGQDYQTSPLVDQKTVLNDKLREPMGPSLHPVGS
jgi:hypothetical protein